MGPKSGALAIAVVLAWPLAGCHDRPKTPEEAFMRLERAVVVGDAAAFYQLLDQQTRWAVQSAFSDQRMQRTIISAKYPEDEARQALARLQAADEPDPASYFAHVDRERQVLAGYRARLGSGEISARADGAEQAIVGHAGGAPLRFHHDRDGSWGLAELEADWAAERDRASHAIKTVRDNAALYRKAEAQ